MRSKCSAEAKPKRCAGSVKTRVTLQVGGTPADAQLSLDKFLKKKSRIKVGRKLGASELVKAERR
jgi:hypothetical protein